MCLYNKSLDILPWYLHHNVGVNVLHVALIAVDLSVVLDKANGYNMAGRSVRGHRGPLSNIAVHHTSSELAHKNHLLINQIIVVIK